MICLEALDKNLNLQKLEEKILDFWKNEDVYSLIKKKKMEKNFGDLLMVLHIQQAQFI